MTWAMVGGAAVSVVGGMISGNKSKKANAQQERGRRDTAIAAGDDMMMGAGEYYNGQEAMRGEYMDRYSPYRDRMLGGANARFDDADRIFAQAKDFNPKTHARERYTSALALMAPSDQAAQSSLMQDLANKGGFGLTTNVSSAPIIDAQGNVVASNGTAGVNPMVSTFLNAQNQRNAGMSYKSLTEGEEYLDRILGRGRGMLGTGYDMMNKGMAVDENGFRMRDAGLQTLFNARNRRAQLIAGVQQDPGFGANTSAQQWRTGTNELSGMVKGIDWGKIGGMFGSGQNWGGGQAHNPNAPMAGNEPLY